MGLLLSKYGFGPTEERVQRHTTQVIAHASRVGLGAELVQEKNGES
mgnify:FL=1